MGGGDGCHVRLHYTTAKSDNAGVVWSTEYRAAGRRSGTVVQDQVALSLIEPSDPEGLWKAAPNEP